MNLNWQPGAVARAAYPNWQDDTYTDRLIVRGKSCWARLDDTDDFVSDESPRRPADPRPVALVDPETSEDVLRFIKALDLVTDRVPTESVHPDRHRNFVAAFRHYAHPGALEPEPTDPRARVTDRRDNIWRLLADGDWVCTSGPDIGEYLVWSRLAAERGPLEVTA